MKTPTLFLFSLSLLLHSCGQDVDEIPLEEQRANLVGRWILDEATALQFDTLFREDGIQTNVSVMNVSEGIETVEYSNRITRHMKQKTIEFGEEGKFELAMSKDNEIQIFRGAWTWSAGKGNDLPMILLESTDGSNQMFKIKSLSHNTAQFNIFSTLRDTSDCCVLSQKIDLDEFYLKEDRSTKFFPL